MQKIEIKNFGPITELTLDIKDFMLFIGPQASGKSTIAKTIFFFKSLNDDLVKFFMEAVERNDFSKPTGSFGKIVRQKFMDYFGGSKHLSNIFLKYYFSPEIWIQITLEKEHKYISPTFSSKFSSEINKLAKTANDFSKSLGIKNTSLLTSKDLLQIENNKRLFYSNITAKCNELFGEDRELLFIPAGRSLLATLSDQLQFIEPRTLDYLMKTFVNKINLLRPIFNQSLNDIITARMALTKSDIDFSKIRLAEKLINRILKGKYQFDKEGEKIYIGNTNKFVRLNFASSGQQESLWILLLLFIIILEQQKIFIVIEEPEAHLFPEAQKEISALIALLSNMKQSQVIITTHSPYILASVNNLILAHKIGKKFPHKVTPKINKHLWINRNKIFAAMVQSGIVSEIIDPEFDIIQQECIDSVSQIINEEFDYLYQYETDETNA
ncbi:MAG: ATP-binding protein [Prevotellaceae bacterium]|jgi:AAA15 family ATPase/GTPase|nr:ATP-binding protein [Prevotellaceae bacterium]